MVSIVSEVRVKIRAVMTDSAKIERAETPRSKVSQFACRLVSVQCYSPAIEYGIK